MSKVITAVHYVGQTTAKEVVSIEDRYGFCYDVTLMYYPTDGFCNALYEDDLIDQCCLNKLHQPFNDDDRAWEMYEDSFSEWRDAMKENLLPTCEEYFNKIY